MITYLLLRFPVFKDVNLLTGIIRSEIYHMLL